MSRVRQNRMHCFDGGSWTRSLLRRPIMAALGQPRDLSPALPTPAHSASFLPDPTVLPRAERSNAIHRRRWRQLRSRSNLRPMLRPNPLHHPCSDPADIESGARTDSRPGRGARTQWAPPASIQLPPGPPHRGERGGPPRVSGNSPMKSLRGAVNLFSIAGVLRHGDSPGRGPGGRMPCRRIPHGRGAAIPLEEERRAAGRTAETEGSDMLASW